jgi:ATP-dependent Clp protease ATP-binding subunit ClpB
MAKAVGIDLGTTNSVIAAMEGGEPARRLIAAEGFDSVYGARPLRRFISHEVETRIGRALLAGDARDGATVRVGAAGDELVVDFENAPEPEAVPVA